MVMTLKDVQRKMCWRFTSATAPDHKPTYTMTDEEADDAQPALVLPRDWDSHYWEDATSDSPSRFFLEHRDEPIQLLMHYKDAPEGRPLKSDDVASVICAGADPLDQQLTSLRIQMSGGINGIECLWRYEYAQKHEQLCRMPGGGFVSTHGEYSLTQEQVVLAKALWTAELRVKQRDARVKVETAAYNQIICDDQHDL